MPIQGTPLLNREHSEASDSGRLSMHASSYQSKKPAYQKTDQSSDMSRHPIPLVVIPDMSHKRHRSADLSSAPSDDENDTDYVDESEDASESLRPSKRCRIGCDEASPVSQLSSDPILPHREAIAVQGFLNIYTSESGVIYSLELSQTHFPSFFPGTQAESPHSYQRMARSTVRRRFSAEEDAFLIELKAKTLTWSEIEDLFAKRFSHRSMASLQGHHYKLKQLAKHGRRRVEKEASTASPRSETSLSDA